MGKALNWKDLRRPMPSEINPLNKHPISAPPKHMLTTSPAQEIDDHHHHHILPNKS